ncbi:maestro heat-like repeat-containing protein family member 1 isoform X2 [Heliangelus exortis]|uniref:maestro heat-like repeat-containing protein family member 1 isoform X2 n=1 Tax=Heliangelus exortis TaxID=472823 RepID=UPI003A909BCB
MLGTQSVSARLLLHCSTITEVLCFTQAAEMRDRVMLDCILGRLEHNSEELRVEALLLLRKLTAHPTGDEEAIHITVMLAEKLPLLFDDESSQVRELSIKLFGETMGTLVSGKERWMQIIIQGNLVSLLLRMNDKSESVAQASAKALLMCAKILGWRKLKREVKRKRTMRIAEILVERDRDVKYHVHACLPYLRDAQCDVRLAAIKFMALQSLENDPEPRVRSLAAETLQNLETEQDQQRSRWSLRSLFCCFC